MSFRHAQTARYADGRSRPLIDPEVFLRMQVVAYFNGKRSTKHNPLRGDVIYFVVAQFRRFSLKAPFSRENRRVNSAVRSSMIGR